MEFYGEFNPEEIQFLLQYAVVDLLKKGIITMSQDPANTAPMVCDADGAPITQ